MSCHVVSCRVVRVVRVVFILSIILSEYINHNIDKVLFPWLGNVYILLYYYRFLDVARDTYTLYIILTVCIQYHSSMIVEYRVIYLYLMPSTGIMI